MRNITKGLLLLLFILAFSFTAYATDNITYVRMDIEYPVYTEEVHPNEISFNAHQFDQYDYDFIIENDLNSYSQGDELKITMTLTAHDGYTFSDIKKHAVKVSDVEPDEIEISGDGRILTVHFTFPALSVRLGIPQNLILYKDGLAEWVGVENADKYTVDIEAITDMGERKFLSSFDTTKTSADLRDVIYSSPGDYLFSVTAKSERYFRADSERAELPYQMSVLITDEDVGLSPDFIDADGRMWYDNRYVTDKEYKVGGRYYYFGRDSYPVTGWQKRKGQWFYYDPVKHYRVSGLKQIGKYEYYFDKEDGHMCSGFIDVDGDGKEKFFSGNGRATTGWVTHNGAIYYVNSDGSRNLEQLQDNAGNNYIFDSDGRLVRP